MYIESKHQFQNTDLRQKYCLFDSNKQCFCYPDKSKIKQYHVIVTTLGLAQELLNNWSLYSHFY